MINEHLHDWHKKTVLDFISEKDGMRILDVGCGYGRLSLPLINQFPHLEIIGLDISQNYVTLYKKNTNRPAFVEAIENIPMELGAFDDILCVNVLMYLDRDQLKRAISNLLSHLKPDGKLILIEPHLSGHLFQTGFGLTNLFPRQTDEGAHSTGGRCFKSGEIETLICNARGKVISEQRLPASSLFFLPLTLVGAFFPERIGRGICKRVSLLDAFSGKFKLPSIQVAYLIARS